MSVLYVLVPIKNISKCTFYKKHILRKMHTNYHEIALTYHMRKSVGEDKQAAM